MFVFAEDHNETCMQEGF